MAWWTTLGLAGGTAAGGAAVAVVGAAAFVGYVFIYPQFRPADPTPEPPVEIAAPAMPMPDQAVAAPAIPEPAAAVAAPINPEPAAPVVDAGPPPPVFDVVRIDAQGAALIAGIAEAGVQIDILLDGIVVFESRTGGDGRFVALFDIAGSEQPRSLQLAAIALDATTTLSEQTVLVAPFGAVAPAAVAEIAPQAPATQSDAPAQGVKVAPPSVPETPAAPQLIIADASGVRPLQPGRVPQAPTTEARANVIIDTISYDATGAVELAGRGTAQAFVRIYLDNTSVAESGVTQSGGWEAVLADVTPGIYTLRVDELDDAGRVTSRFETPFKREDPKLLAQIAGALTPAAPVEQTTVPDAPLAGIADTLATAPVAPVAPVADEPATRIASTSQDSAPVVAPAPVVPVLPTTSDAAPITPPASVITVQPGFTLWQIARERFGEGELYVQVFEANRDQIKDPNRIFPGQVFTLPDVSDRR